MVVIKVYATFNKEGIMDEESILAIRDAVNSLREEVEKLTNAALTLAVIAAGSHVSSDIQSRETREVVYAVYSKIDGRV
jgi:hypothetical protein